MSWYVLHVRPRCEKKLADYCAKHGLAHDLPLREESKVYQRRRVKVWKPLFPGYVFCVFLPGQRGLILRSNHVARVIPVVDQERLIEELAQIHRALSADPTLGACRAFTRGRPVRIVRGPFRGIEGVVRTVRGETRVVLNVDMIGQAVAVDVVADDLEPTD